MTSLLVIIVLVLLAIAVWQLTKIFDLTQISTGATPEDSGVATDRDNNIQGYLMFGFLAFIYIITIFCLAEYGNLPLLSDSASEHGELIDNLMILTLVIIFFVQTVTQAVLHYFSFKYRGKQGNTALYFADNDRLEFIWSVIPAIVLAGLILYGLYAWTNIMYVDEDENPIVVEVYAKQFSWEVRYSGQDNVLGKANVRYIEGTNTLGVDLADPHSQDDITAGELHLPKGRKVLFKLRSQDVLHSFYLPHFRAQMNCVPGMVTQFAFIPKYTTEEMRNRPGMPEKVAHINEIRANRSKELIAQGKEGLDPYTFDYVLLCNKICGASHYNMQMKVVVHEQADFDKWLSEQKTISQKIAEGKAQNEPAGDPAKAADSTAGAAAAPKEIALAN
jgi:cytochrome c oxidase subunit 2